MQVLVTGANGLLGSHVVGELLKRNYRVRVLVRPESNLSALEGLPIDFFMGQLSDKQDVEQAVAGCAFVVHAAARAVHKPTHLDAFRQINIESTRYIVEACIKSGVRRLVHVSTANCYVNGTKTHPGTEAGHFPGWMKQSGYAYSKFLAQQLVMEQVGQGRLDAVVVSPTFIIGKDAKPEGGRIFNFIINKKVGFRPTGGKNFVDAGVAATGVVNALEKGKTGESYLLAGENLSYRQFYKLVNKYAKQHTLMIPVPCLLLKLAGRAGDFAEKVLNKPVELTYVNARMLCLDNYYTAEKAAKEIDFPVVPIRDSIEKSVLWFKNHQAKTAHSY